VHGVIVIDDYAHHPTEIMATLEAASSGWPDRRIVAVFQPHLYSRTRDFSEGFARAFFNADVLVLTDIFRRGRPPFRASTARCWPISRVDTGIAACITCPTRRTCRNTCSPW
jgi:UDP-N-acetylmuramate--alanine ligase